jgi:hypothetical protein
MRGELMSRTWRWQRNEHGAMMVVEEEHLIRGTMALLSHKHCQTACLDSYHNTYHTPFICLTLEQLQDDSLPFPKSGSIGEGMPGWVYYWDCGKKEETRGVADTSGSS